MRTDLLVGELALKSQLQWLSSAEFVKLRELSRGLFLSLNSVRRTLTLV